MRQELYLQSHQGTPRARAEIQELDLLAPGAERNPYAGHIYIGKFDAWTYAKNCLWSSLMYQILTGLNQQLELQASILIRIIDALSKNNIQYLQLKGFDWVRCMDRRQELSMVQLDVSALARRGKNANVTKALGLAVNEHYDDDNFFDGEGPERSCVDKCSSMLACAAFRLVLRTK
jgi:hypothetical protein